MISLQVGERSHWQCLLKSSLLAISPIRIPYQSTLERCDEYGVTSSIVVWLMGLKILFHLSPFSSPHLHSNKWVSISLPKMQSSHHLHPTNGFPLLSKRDKHLVWVMVEFGFITSRRNTSLTYSWSVTSSR